MIELNTWVKEIWAGHHSSIREPRSITHEFQKVTGGRVMYAGITIKAAPSDTFALRVSPGIPDVFVRAAKHAVFSALVGAAMSPVLRLRIELADFKYNESDSTYASFYLAAKEAMEIILGTNGGGVWNVL
jgi:hypothetical protein